MLLPIIFQTYMNAYSQRIPSGTFYSTCVCVSACAMRARAPRVPRCVSSGLHADSHSGSRQALSRFDCHLTMSGFCPVIQCLSPIVTGPCSVVPCRAGLPQHPEVLGSIPDVNGLPVGISDHGALTANCSSMTCA